MGFDIDKTVYELQKSLQSKILRFIYKYKLANKIVLPINKPLALKILEAGEKYRNKYINASRVDTADDAINTIKMYSDYIALKRVSSICDEILDCLHANKNLSDDQVKKFTGALATAELLKEQKKFKLRLEHNKLGQSKEEIKLAEFVNAYEKMKESNISGICTIGTPFGNIDIKYFIDKGTNRRNVYVYPAGKWHLHLKYKPMSEILDNELENFSIQNVKVAFVECIRKYVTQKIQTNKRFAEVLSGIKYNFVHPNLSSDIANENAAVLCGCLLFAESCEVRNPTRCKWETKAIEKVKRIVLQGGIGNPFSIVFAGEAPLYDPAYTPAGSRGMKPSAHLITGYVNIFENMLDEKHNSFFKDLEVNGVSHRCKFSDFKELTQEIASKRKIDCKVKKLIRGLKVEDPQDELRPLFEIWTSAKLKKKGNCYLIKYKDFLEILSNGNNKAKDWARNYKNRQDKGYLALAELNS